MDGTDVQHVFKPSLNIEAFPKTEIFGKATLDLAEKADFWPLFPKPFPKPTGFCEWLYNMENFEFLEPMTAPSLYFSHVHHTGKTHKVQ
jgi:hypothetical protein